MVQTACRRTCILSLAALMWMVAGRASVGEPSTLPAGALNVKDYGAKGDGIADDAPALNRALVAAVRRGPGAILFIPAGTYCIGERTLGTGAKKGGFHLGISDADGVTVEGDPGTLLLCRNLTRTL